MNAILTIEEIVFYSTGFQYEIININLTQIESFLTFVFHDQSSFA